MKIMCRLSLLFILGFVSLCAQAQSSPSSVQDSTTLAGKTYVATATMANDSTFQVNVTTNPPVTGVQPLTLDLPTDSSLFLSEFSSIFLNYVQQVESGLSIGATEQAQATQFAQGLWAKAKTLQAGVPPSNPPPADAGTGTAPQVDCDEASNSAAGPITFDQTFAVAGKNYVIRMRSKTDGWNTVRLYPGDAEECQAQSFKLKPMGYTHFVNGFREAFNQIPGAGGTNAEQTQVAGQLFFEARLAGQVQAETRPIAGWLEVQDSVIVLIHQGLKLKTVQKLHNEACNAEKNTQKILPWPLSGGSPPTDSSNSFFFLLIDSIKIEFYQGFIENLLVIGHLPGSKTYLKFTNDYPIGFSSKLDFKRLGYTWLREDLYEPLIESWSGQTDRPEPRRAKKSGEGGRKHHMSMNAGSLIQFVQNLDILTRDYSPMDTAMWFFPDGKRRPVYRDQTEKLFEARVFSDFVGFDATEPNGLVQTEVEKVVPLWTQRFGGLVTNIGLLGWIEPMIGISKLESNNRALPIQAVRQNDNGTLVENKYAETLNLLNYENFQTGADLNLFTLDAPSLKSTFQLNLSTRFGRTELKDSIFELDSLGSIVGTDKSQEFGANTFRYGGEFRMGIFPQRRYSFFFSQSINQFNLMNNRLTQVANGEQYALSNALGDVKTYNRFEFLAVARLGATGETFFRYRFHWQLGDSDVNFHQAQVGYSFFLLQQRK